MSRQTVCHRDYLNLQNATFVSAWEPVYILCLNLSFFAVFCFSINQFGFSGYGGMVNCDLVVAIKLKLAATTQVPTT